MIKELAVVLVVIWYSPITAELPNTRAAHVDEFLERYQRSPFTPDFHYDDESPYDGIASCTSECGGELREAAIGCDIRSEVQVNCYTGFMSGVVCCVSKSCHDAMGVCRQNELDPFESELASSGMTCREGYTCFRKKCEFCGGVCTTSSSCSGGFRKYPGRSCTCSKGHICCLDPDLDPGFNSCKFNSHCQGRCIDKDEDCEPTEKQCVDEPCVCTKKDKCCLKKCNLKDGVDKCAETFPGRGKCRPQCQQGFEVAYHLPGLCENRCSCCKQLVDCESNCKGVCSTSPIDGFVEKKYCECPNNKLCWIPKRMGGHPNVIGDPKYSSFDGMDFKFHGICSYVLFQECVMTPRFKVIAKHASAEDMMGHQKAYVVAVRVIVYNTVIDLTSKEVKINGSSVLSKLPMTVEGGVKIFVDTLHKRVHVELSDIFTVTWNGNGNVKASVENDWHGTVCGMLGDSDGDASNDMKMLLPTGRLKFTQNATEFGYSWEIPGSCDPSYDLY